MSKRDEKDEPKSERFNMFISPTEMGAIDEWAWKNRIRSKSEAVRRLCQIGLAYDSAVAEVDEQMEYIEVGLHELMNAFDTWENDYKGEAAEDIFEKVINTMNNAARLLRILADAEERRRAWMTDDNIEQVLKTVERLERKLKIYRESENPRMKGDEG